MKKIYILTAVFALLTLSLNAQKLPSVDRSQLRTAQTSSTSSFHNMVKSIKGMSGILPEVNPNRSSSKGQSRAPLKINSDETTVGPFTGNYFDPNAGMGFGNAYNQAQMVLIEVDLDRSDYANYIGEEIVGFRLALAGDATRTVQVGEFIAWPMNSNGSWDTNNRYTWSIGELTTPAGNPYYEKVTSTSGLESGAEYLIVYENDNVAFNGGLTTLDVGNNVISVNRNGTIIESNATTDAATFTITANGNYYTIRSKSGYYIGRTSSRNGMDTNANSAYNNSITFSNNNVVIRGRGTTNNNTYYLRFNSSSGNDNYRFRYYAQTSQQNIQLYKKVTPTAPAYVALQDGQWHEFYLDNPVTFNVGSDNAGLSLGYTYVQYPTGTTGQNLFPIGINPQSTTHDHYAYLTTTTSGNGSIVITVPSYNTMFQTITIIDNNTGTTLDSWSSSESTVSDGTNTYYEMPSGWTLSNVYMFPYTTSGYTFGYLSSASEASITIDPSVLNGSTNVRVEIEGAALEDNQTIDVNGDTRTLTSGYLFDETWNPVDLSGGSSTSTGYNYFDFSQYGDLAVQLIFKSKKLTPEAPTVTNVVGDENVTITITPDPNTDGDLVYYVDNNGNHVQDLTFPRGETDYTVTVHAYTEETDDYNESPEAVVPVVIPHLTTATPVITVSDPDENGNVTVTATGNGTVTLTIGDQTVTGNGTASITLTPRVNSYTVTATATAKEDGKAASDPATREVTVTPAGGEWLEMYGTYNNPNDLLSLQSLEVDEDGEHLEIMMIDQFLASTLHNDHPNGYTYTMKETINNEEKSSNTVDIPVYKTSSTMQGFYTLNQIEEDEDMHLKAQVINSQMNYEVNPDHNTLYHSLYRSDLNGEYPVVDVQHRVSQLQKYEENVNDNIQYFFTEMHNEGVTPKYTHVGNEIVSPLDTNYVQGIYNDELSYVPVIWTFGLYTARGDGKNNSYGSDIKREKLGDVQIVNVGGSMSGANNVEDTGAGWEGLFKVGNEWYCIYTPIITVEGITPETFIQGDGDVSEYEPYLYRVWCLYPGAHSFKHVAQQNAQGQTVQVLADDGPRPAPFLLGSEQITDPNVNRVTIGRDWHNGEGPLQWSFAVPCSVSPSDVEFAVRFYYKKKVTNAQASNGLRGNRDGGDDNEYYIVEGTGNASGIPVSVNELYAGKAIVGVTYVNSLGMQSDKPFDGLNIVVTRYSDGTTSTTKVIR